MNEVRPVIPIYLGLSKAFHSSIHDILLDNLISMQPIRTVRWIRKVSEPLGSRGWDQWHSWMQVLYMAGDDTGRNALEHLHERWAMSQSIPSNKFTGNIKLGKIVAA